MQELLELAIKELAVEKVSVFGSRARGDESSKSDFDLAFWVPKSHCKNWKAFSVNVRDSAKTLHDLDLIVFYSASKSMQEKIQIEGVIIYERPQN